jgi:hypothetical protein
MGGADDDHHNHEEEEDSSDEEVVDETIVSQLGENDILCSGEGGEEWHPGNVRFRNLVNAAKVRFQIPC